MPAEPIEHLTTRTLTAALDAGSIRHRVIATNIAHAQTPGYTPVGARFEALVSRGLDGRPDAVRLDAALVPRAEGQGLGSGVQLDVEMSALAENALHQQVLMRALQRHLGLLATAATEGKR